MAHSDKNILITPNIGSTTADPKVVFSGADATTGAQTITLQVYPTNSGTLSFEGSAGQLFSITNSLSGTIYSVNDISGIPSIEVLDTGLVKLAQYSGNVLLGTGTDNGTDKLQVNGSILGTTLKGTTLTSTVATGTSPLTVSSTTVVDNLNADLWDGYQFSSYLNQSVRTDSAPTFSEVYINGWFRNNASGNGLYNQSTGQHFYSDDDDYWNIAGGSAANGLRFRDEHAGTIRGYVYANNSNEIGFLDQNGNWTLRMNGGIAYATTFSGALSGNATTATNVAASGITGQTGMWTSAARPGPYRLYRNDDNSAYNVQTTWSADVSGYWSLRGYSGDTYHAPCYVAKAGDADTLDGNHSSAFYLASNPSGYTTNTGTVTSVSGTGSTSGLSLSGTVTTSGSITLSGSVTSVSGAADQAIVNQHNGNAASWYGRILSKNSTSDKAAFLGTYGSIAGVFSHNNALSAWADLYVNNVDGSNGGAVRLPTNTYIAGNTVWHAGNDGSGSGLDADLLDGNHASVFYLASNPSGYTTNTGTVTSVATGTGLSGGTITTSGTISLADTAVTAGSYTAANITVDAQGRITAASNGSSGSSVTISDDTTTNATRYLVFEDVTSGTSTSMQVSSTKLTFNPSTGNLTAAGNITAYSDERLKTNIETIKNAVEKVKCIRGVVFDRIDTNNKQTGVIAQEVQKVLPEAVQEGDDGILSVAYGNLVGLLIEAIKEQDQKISRLEKLLENK